ncbi:MAG: thermonuclease family protein, partial [Candidatus Omnitrophica bacterium]|nr:thermonuclease family protein [Candidatus Omnitrophota bacterium]
QLYTVERVIDGDTFKLTTGENVRLIGIDTPESKKNDKAKRDAQRTNKDVATITAMGKESTRFVKENLLSKGTIVLLEYDVQKKDRYGRILAYAYLYSPSAKFNSKTMITKDNKTYIFINAEIIAKGYAQPMTIPPNVKYSELFQKLYQEARTHNRGLWKSP